jgi:RIO kinase 1
VGKNRTNEEAADLAALVESAMLDEVLGVVKSGKEATVYCCRAGERMGGGFVAAKVYRARIVRQFANASTYNAGRLRSRGMRDGIRSREIRAMQSKSRLGQELSFGKWVADEWETLQLLHGNGVGVPEPLTMSERIILMEFIGDEEAPAPLLADADVSPSEAAELFQFLLDEIERILACDRIHADLSPFNVLYWEGRARVIDVPQAVDARFNPNAVSLLDRDVERICQWAARHGIPSEAWRISRDMWARYIRGDL